MIGFVGLVGCVPVFKRIQINELFGLVGLYWKAVSLLILIQSCMVDLGWLGWVGRRCPYVCYVS